MSSEQPIETDPQEPAPDPVLPWRGLWLIAAAVVVYSLDVVTKVLAVAKLENREPVELLGGALYLQLIRNPGAAFSMATGMTWLFTIVAAGVTIAIIWILPKLRSTGWAIGLGLVLAGAMGNLTDRLFRAPGVFEGHVVDMISVFAPNGDFFPVFNVADMGISCGGVLIVVMTLFGRDYDGKIVKSGKAAKAEQADKAEKGGSE
ncbi:signal peptidase II [Actinokineospora guangxiensis]|uniref:Lipoprotein signal peptidase n=1 Tax=Actinokineospora guangxiensis TaxID=1490288 RepID=A0ABW0ESG5_9PSEU